MIYHIYTIETIVSIKWWCAAIPSTFIWSIRCWVNSRHFTFQLFSFQILYLHPRKTNIKSCQFKRINYSLEPTAFFSGDTVGFQGFLYVFIMFCVIFVSKLSKLNTFHRHFTVTWFTRWMLTPVAGSRRCFGGMVFDDPGRISLVDNVVMNPKPAMIMGIVCILICIYHIYIVIIMLIFYIHIYSKHIVIIVSIWIYIYISSPYVYMNFDMTSWML